MLHFESWIAGYLDSEPLIRSKRMSRRSSCTPRGPLEAEGGRAEPKKEMVHWLLMAVFMRSKPSMAEIFDFTDDFKPLRPRRSSTWQHGPIASHPVHRSQVVLPREPQSEIRQKTIEEEKIAAGILVPVMTFFLLLSARPEQVRQGSLKLWVSGRPYSPTETRKQINQHFPNVKPGNCLPNGDEPGDCGLRPSDAAGHEESVGKAVPFIGGAHRGRERQRGPTGAVGEAVYRGPTVMQEYYKDPKATANAKRGGWFHSGDLARIDEDGFRTSSTARRT